MPWSDQTGKVMKKPGEYSTNPNTVRVRARKARLDPFVREVEQARASDKKAITRALTLECRKAGYAAASPATRIKMLEEAERVVMDRRASKGYDADSKIKRFLDKNDRATPTSPSSTDSPSKMDDYNYRTMTSLRDFAGQQNGLPPSESVNNRFATSRQHRGQHAASIEEQQPLNGVSYLAQQHLRLGPPQPTSAAQFGPYPYGPNPQSSEYKPASESTTHVQMNYRNQEDQIDHLMRIVSGLTQNLVAAQHTINSQERRLDTLEQRLDNVHDAASGFAGQHAHLAREAPKLRRIVMGIQKISNAATEVCDSLASGGSGNAEAGSAGGARATLDTNSFVNEFAQRLIPNHTNQGRSQGIRDDNPIVVNDSSNATSDNGSDTPTAQGKQAIDEDMNNAEEVKDAEIVVERAKKRLRSAGKLHDE